MSETAASDSAALAPAAEPQDAAPLCLDFSGRLRFARPPAGEGEDPAPASAADVLARLTTASFADRGALLPDAAGAGRFALDMVRNTHRLAGRPKRTELVFCAGPGPTPLPPGLHDIVGLDIQRTDEPGALVAALTPKTAAVLISPVRLNGTLEVLPGSLLAELRQACDDYGVALMFDESESGLGRTGMMWAHEWTGVTPDVLLVSGGLAASPLAAVLATAKFARGAPPAPAIASAAVAEAADTLDRLLAPGAEGEIQARGWALEDRLATLSWRHRDLFPATCGLGLMQGLVCAGDAAELITRAAAEGLALRPLGPVLGLFPPLDVTEAELDAAAEILGRLVA